MLVSTTAETATASSTYLHLVPLFLAHVVRFTTFSSRREVVTRANMTAVDTVFAGEKRERAKQKRAARRVHSEQLQCAALTAAQRENE